MKSLIKGIFISLIVVGICLAALRLIQFYTDVRVVASPRDFIGSFASILLAQALLFFLAMDTWRHLVSKISGVNVSVRDSAFQTGMMYVAKYIPGKVWGIAMRTMMARSSGVSSQDMLRASFLELMIYLVVAFTLGISILPALSISEVFIFAALSIVMSALLLRFSSRFGISILSRIAGFLFRNGNLEIDSYVPDLKLALALAARCVLQWILIVLINFQLCPLVGIGQDAETFRVIAYATIVSVALGFVAIFSPGGIGVREGVFTVFAGSDIGIQSALALSVLSRLWSVQFDMFGAALAGIAYKRSMKRT